jgi:hypothetical protein
MATQMRSPGWMLERSKGGGTESVADIVSMVAACVVRLRERRSGGS